MNTKRYLAAVVLVAAGLAGCSRGGASAADGSPVTLTETRAADGTAVKQVQLVEHAVERIGITTGTVQRAVVSVNGVSRPSTVVPYAAVVYDNDGRPWVYVNNAPRSYVRAAITVAAIQGDVAVLTVGPPQGTPVVTQGAPELLGTEAEIAGEQ